MGASGWRYVVDYHGDPAAALTALREQVMASRDFYWLDEDEWPAPRPTTLAQLDQLREEEEFWEVGTHSILDVDRVIASSQPDGEAAVRELSEAEARAAFGTTTPSREQFEERGWDLPEGPRWSGRYQLLYDGGRASRIAFWGFSGD